MTRYMADACSSAALPGWQLQGSYVDGRCIVDRHDLVRISSLASNAGNAGDVEPGNPYWDRWVPWVVMRRQAHEDPYLYCCADGYGDDAVWGGWRHADGVNAFHNARVPEPHWWVFQQSEAIPDYAMMCQFAWNVQPGYDISSARPYLPGIDIALPGMEDELFIFNGPDNIGYLVCPLGLVPLPDDNFANQLAADGIKWYHIDQANHDALLAAAQKSGTLISGNVPVSLSGTGTLKVG